MKYSTLAVIVGASLILGGNLFAASVQPEGEESARDHNLDAKEILEYGNKKDVSKIADLRRIRSRTGESNELKSESAQMALAKLGEKKEMDEILAEAQSRENFRKSKAIEKLGYVQNKQAINRLIELLDETESKVDLVKGKNGKMRASDVMFDPPAYDAVRALRKIFLAGPKSKTKNPTKTDIAAWKEWWKENGKRLQ